MSEDSVETSGGRFLKPWGMIGKLSGRFNITVAKAISKLLLRS